ncbi:MAG TPA: glutamate--tRNA ligase [Bacillota bacterium]|nr:glutamate--tRNA ligase [Bacillota bacterium]
MVDQNTRVRFAPSPTGPLHIGGARSALFNWLWARKTGGKFIVRIEDTDLERSSRESEENILAALRWLGMDWDEGIEVGGEHGPYRQTERLDLYRQATERLLQEGKAYYCYCSEEELEAEREELLAKGELPRYLGKCRHLTKEDRDRLEAEGRKPVVRFRVPDDEIILIHDRVRGEVKFESNGIGDYVIVKSDGIPTYNFAVVIDDLTMKITQVIRGEEHLSNTPRQVLIYQALGETSPEFAHVSLILGKDRSKMSKRHGSTAVEQYQAKGYLPEALVNFLALLGWSPVGEEEVFSLEQLVDQFSLDRVAKNPAVFDQDKLNYLNGHYIRMAPTERIVEMALPYLQEAGYVEGEITEARLAWLTMMVKSVQEKIDYVAQIVDHVKIFFENQVTLESPEAAQILAEEQVPQVLEALQTKLAALEVLDEAGVKGVLKAITKELKLGGKQVYMPIRIALTGQMHGPELFYIIPLLGLDKIRDRIAQTTSQVTK